MEATTKILIVEDNPLDLQFIQNELKRSKLAYVAAVVDTREDFVQSLKNFTPNLILADFSLAHFSGLEAFKIKQEMAPDTAFILVSGLLKEEQSVRLINHGVTDFISKDKLFGLNVKVKRALHEAKEQQSKKNTEQQLDIIYNSVQDIIFMLEVEAPGQFAFISANQAFLQLTGLQPDQVIGKYADAVITPASRQLCMQMFEQVLHTKQPAEWEQDFAGGQHAAHVRVTPIINHLGICTHLVGSAHDTTRQTLLLRSLEKSNQRNEYVGKASFDAIFDWDMATRQVYRGEGYHNLFGVMDDETSTIEMLCKRVHPADRTQLLASASIFLRGKATNWQYEHHYLKSNGDYAFVCTRALAIRNAQGRAIRIIGAMQDMTQKKSLQAALDTAIKVARFGTWELDMVCNKLYWSDMIREVAEAPDDYELVLDTALLLYKEGASRALITQKITEAVEQGVTFDIEAELVTPSGKEKWIRVLGVPQFKNGVCTKITGSMQDIDSRKRAELTVNKMLKARNKILESIADAFFAIDKNWIFSYWNNQAEKIFGQSRKNVVGKNIWDVFPDRIGSKEYNEYHKALAAAKLSRFEDYNPRLEKWFSISCYPAENGGLAVYIKEITERKRSELRLREMNQHLQKQAAELALSNQELKESEKRFSDIFNLSPQPMFLFVAGTLQFVQVNEAAIRLYGYSAEEFGGMRLTDIKVEDDSSHLTNGGGTPDNTPEIYNRVHKHRKKSGEVIEVEIYSNHITVNGKSLRSVIAIDVTEKNQQEYKILKAIIKTQEDERYEIGGELHDNVCQILAGSQLFLGMLEADLTQPKKGYYQHCMANIQLALEETRNLSHRLAPAFLADATLEDAFRKMMNNFIMGNSMEIKLHFDAAINEHNISLEAQLNLYRILQEHIRNIVKHARAPLVQVDIIVHADSLIMTITDNGVGFNTSKEKSGIGLANMRRRTELFSGKFRIQSSPGHGCTVEVIIPLEDIRMRKGV